MSQDFGQDTVTAGLTLLSVCACRCGGIMFRGSPASGASPLTLATTDVAPSGGREAIAGLLMREREAEYTQLKTFR